MNRELNIARSLESKNKINRYFNATDGLFILTYLSFTWALEDQVHDSLRYIYYIFSFAIAFYLTRQSFSNVKRKIYMSLVFFLQKDTFTYKPYYHNQEGED